MIRDQYRKTRQVPAIHFDCAYRKSDLPDHHLRSRVRLCAAGRSARADSGIAEAISSRKRTALPPEKTQRLEVSKESYCGAIEVSTGGQPPVLELRKTLHRPCALLARKVSKGTGPSGYCPARRRSRPSAPGTSIPSSAAAVFAMSLKFAARQTSG